jgi:hypothetical protein
MLVRGTFVAPQLLATNSATTLTSSSASTITHGSGKPPAPPGPFVLTSVWFLCDCGGRAREWSRSPGGRYPRLVILRIQYADLGKRNASQYVALGPAGHQQVRAIGRFVDLQHEKHLAVAIDLHSFKKHRGVHVAIVRPNLLHVNPGESRIQLAFTSFYIKSIVADANVSTIRICAGSVLS